MKFQITEKLKLKRPPTAICHFQNKVYVATKGKRVFYTADMKSSKSVLFSEQVNSLTTNSDVLYASQRDGKVFGLNPLHKTVFSVLTGDFSSIQSFFDKCNNTLFIGSDSKKISAFSDNGLLKNTIYFNENRLCYFDVNEDSMLAQAFQNDQNVLFNLGKDKFTIKILDGYPEVVKFLQKNSILIGSSTGCINCFSTVTKKRISSIKLDKPISSIHVLNQHSFIVGVPNQLLLIDCSNFNKMEVVSTVDIDGIPVEITGKNELFCAISRESRMGRWLKCRDGHNEILKVLITK